jgi:hypothetical protein
LKEAGKVSAIRVADLFAAIVLR